MSTKPRTHAGDLESIKQSPAFAHLVGEPRWVTWQWLYRPAKNGSAGKWTKPPLQACSATIWMGKQRQSGWELAVAA